MPAVGTMDDYLTRDTLLLHHLGDGSLYVPGAPGSGKTTFCRWLALLAAGGTLPDHPIPAPEGFRETLPDALRARFPLLCREPKPQPVPQPPGVPFGIGTAVGEEDGRHRQAIPYYSQGAPIIHTPRARTNALPLALQSTARDGVPDVYFFCHHRIASIHLNESQ